MRNYWGVGEFVSLVILPLNSFDDLANAPDDRGADNLVKLWDIGQRSCVSTTSSTAEVWGFDWQPVAANTFAVGKQFAVAGDDRAVTLYRAAGSA